MRFLFPLPTCQKLKRTININCDYETEKEELLYTTDITKNIKIKNWLTFLKSKLAKCQYFKDAAYSDSAIH